ncbi:MAG TPA: DUF3772 domain-containing protein [Ideonella sp.]|nr:DUF3772 domain-containing protein [Ideonella sp.]
MHTSTASRGHRAAAHRIRGYTAWLVIGLLHGLLCGLFGLPGTAFAAATTPSSADIADPDLDRARQRIETLQGALLSAQPDTELVRLRGVAQSVRAEADAADARLQPQLTSVQARLSELGPRSAKEADDIAALRAELEKSRATLDTQARIARLLSLEAEQAAGQILALRRAQFQANLGTHTASILSVAFWSELRSSVAPETGRVAALGREIGTAFTSAPGPVHAGLLLAVLAVLGLRWVARRVLWHVATVRIRPGRLRRSFHAAATVAVAVATPGLIALALVLAIDWEGRLSRPTESLLATGVGVLCFGGYVAGLGRALLATRRPSWRLTALPDAVAHGLRHFPMLLAVLVVSGWLAERLSARVNASVETLVALDCIVSLSIGLAMGLAQMRGERLRRQALHDPQQADSPPRPAWAALLAGVLWCVLAGSLAGLLSGYVALGSLVIKQVVWIVVVIASAYLAAVLIEDLCSGLLASPRGEAPPGELAGAALRSAQVRDQVAVLLSGGGRVLVALLALVLIVAPFGEGPIDLFRRGSALGASGLAIGEAQIRPLALLQAALVLVLGLGGVSLLKGWLAERYLPTTRLEPGMRTSTVTMFGYAGAVIVVALALSASGFGLERVAWVASALSVGIGFGLQGVVQNFVSGLIVLAERPVKVGDWVSLGGVEGDIRRINVRATEIQLSDRSTVIVPNSEFITKTVRNVTHGNPLGLVQIKLPMPLDTDADQVRTLLLEAFQRHEDVLETPAPGVELDGIAGTSLVFNATGMVNSPRMAYRVRSALLFEVLKRLREAGLPMSNPATVLLEAPPPLPQEGGGSERAER